MLAVQRRGVDAVDVDTGESVFVPISVILADGDGDGHGTGSGEDTSGGKDNGDGSQGGAEGGGADGARTDTSGAAGGTVMSGTGGREGVSSGGGGGGGSGGGSGGGGGDCSAGGARGAAGRTVSLVTPCVLPELKEVSRLSIRSPRYFPVELDLAGNPAVATALQRRCRIYVKRRVGHLSYKNVSGGGKQGDGWNAGLNSQARRQKSCCVFSFFLFFVVFPFGVFRRSVALLVPKFRRGGLEKCVDFRLCGVFFLAM